MSRSYKKVSTFGYGNISEKKDKRINNRRLRHCNRIRLNQGKELLVMKEVSDEWSMNKDGLNHILLNKDNKYYKEGLRK